MPNSEIPKWSRRALFSFPFLFRPLQDIDIYVEDSNSEVFYTQLIKRISPINTKIERIFPLDGRNNVLKSAASHDFLARAALFIIDGDFEWVRGDPAPTLKGVYRLDAYCIENLLICEQAATQIIVEDRVLMEPEARDYLKFDSWLNNSVSLVQLFAVWAVLNKLEPQTPTTSTRIEDFLEGKKPQIDSWKVIHKYGLALARVQKYPSAKLLLDKISKRVSILPFPMDIVSGKDFAIVALEKHMHAIAKSNLKSDSFKFRLARHVNPARFSGLHQALLRASQGNNKHY